MTHGPVGPVPFVNWGLRAVGRDLSPWVWGAEGAQKGRSDDFRVQPGSRPPPGEGTAITTLKTVGDGSLSASEGL